MYVLSIMKGKKISMESPILNFIDKDSIQQFQDRLASELGVALIFAYNGQMVTNGSNACKFCTEYTMNNPNGIEKCKNCALEREENVKRTRQPFIMKCHANLMNFAVPIYIDNIYQGCILGGQVAEKMPEETFFEDLAAELGIEKDSYLKELKNVRVHPSDNINSIVNLLFLFSRNVIPVLYPNNKVEELGNNNDSQQDSKVKEWFTVNYAGIKHPISARELEVLTLLVQGKNNLGIAKALYISVHTVKAHVSSIIEKFGVHDRLQVAVKAIKEGYIE